MPRGHDVPARIHEMVLHPGGRQHGGNPVRNIPFGDAVQRDAHTRTSKGQIRSRNLKSPAAHQRAGGPKLRIVQRQLAGGIAVCPEEIDHRLHRHIETPARQCAVKQRPVHHPYQFGGRGPQTARTVQLAHRRAAVVPAEHPLQTRRLRKGQTQRVRRLHRGNARHRNVHERPEHHFRLAGHGGLRKSRNP